MLYADKQHLKTEVAVDLLRVREKEMNFYSSNLSTVGTQSALLAGFAFGLFLNAALLAQIGYYGAVVEGRPLAALLAADFSSAPEEGARRLKRRGGAALSDSSELDEAEPIV